VPKTYVRHKRWQHQLSQQDTFSAQSLRSSSLRLQTKNVCTTTSRFCSGKRLLLTLKRQSTNQVSSQEGFVLGAMALELWHYQVIAGSRGWRTNEQRILDVGANIYWIPRHQGYLYANSEIIKYDAVEYISKRASFAGLDFRQQSSTSILLWQYAVWWNDVPYRQHHASLLIRTTYQLTTKQRAEERAGTACMVVANSVLL
jgi:hypothetical protein